MGSDHESGDVEVHVAQFILETEAKVQPLAEIGEMQKSDSEIGQIWQFVKEGVMPVDSGIAGCVSTSKDCFVVLDSFTLLF